MSRIITAFRRRKSDEQGVVLLLVLGFVVFVGLIGVAVMEYSTTSLRSASNLRKVRATQFAADGAVDVAINRVRLDAAWATNNDCFSYTFPSSGQPVRVTCSVPNSTKPNDVHFVAYRKLTNPLGDPIMVADVRFDRTNPADVKTQVLTWSVAR